MGHLKDRPYRRRWGTVLLTAGLYGALVSQGAFAAPVVGLPDFTPIVQQYGPAVVNISSTSTKMVHSQMPANPLPPNSPFYPFFRHFFSGPNQGPAQKEKVESLGSGFIITPTGYIVTAAHVVRGADHIVVGLSNHHVYKAKLIGLSVRYDTALLKIDGHNLPVAPLGDSDKMQVGQWLLAVGAPFGFYNTVTQGVVSALDRPLSDDEYIPFIQSDVPINPGNSGGPLFNMQGQVIGINDQIYTSSGGYMGLSFSIPINTAMRVVHALQNHQAIRFGWLGVDVQGVSAEMAQAMRLKEPVGALIAGLAHNGPAAKAGLKPGDVIITYDNKPVYSVGQLPPLVGNTQPGEHVPVGIMRHGRALTISVRVGALPKNLETAPSKNVHIPRLRMEVGPLTHEALKDMAIHHGVVVLSVDAGPAQDAGIAPGMVIQQIAGDSVTTPSQMRHIVATLPAATPIPVLVRRGKESLYIVVTLP
ncbi:MAG TPA: Do family serine endopeptidase [Acidiferrobacter sp.]|nr:Do family serine endopeptidase [Acidiferrobacter sp.]